MDEVEKHVSKRKRGPQKRFTQSAEPGSMKTKRPPLGDITNTSSRLPIKSEESRTVKPRQPNVKPVTENPGTEENSESAASSVIEGDPQRFGYASLIFQYLHSLEVDPKRRPLSDYMEKVQTDINPVMRAILIDWLVEVAEEYRLVSDTLYLTVTYIDRFLSTSSLIRKDLQLLGVTCMLIAAKYEEITPPHIEDFCYITDNTYTKEEVVNMERNVLKVLYFEVGNPTIKTFVRIFNKGVEEEPANSYLKHDCLCYYLAELSLLDYGCIRYIPSMIAASVIFLARFTLQPDSRPWTLSLQKQTGYKPRELKDCIKRLHDLQRRSRKNGRAVEQKYMDHKLKCVATLDSRVQIPARFFEDANE